MLELVGVELSVVFYICRR